MASSHLNIQTVKLGDSADLTKNILITTPVVADGTLVGGNMTAVTLTPGDWEVWGSVELLGTMFARRM